MLRKYRRSQGVPAAVTGLCCVAFAPAAQSLPSDPAIVPTFARRLTGSSGGGSRRAVLDNSAIPHFGWRSSTQTRFVADVLEPAMPMSFACGLLTPRTPARAAHAAACE